MPSKIPIVGRLEDTANWTRCDKNLHFRKPTEMEKGKSVSVTQAKQPASSPLYRATSMTLMTLMTLVFQLFLA